MTIDEVIRDFATTGSTLPCESMRWALDHWDNAAPALIDLVERYAGGDVGAEMKDVVFFAVHLFGQRAERRAFPVLCRLMRARQACEAALDDATTETLPQIVISTYDGNRKALAAIVEDDAADDLVRHGALMAMAYLTRTGHIAHNDMRPFMLHLYDEMQPQGDCFVWVAWAEAVAALGYEDLLDRVKRLFRRGFIGRHIMSIDDFRDDLQQTLDDPASMAVFASDHIHPFGDAIEQLSQWYYFTEEHKQDQARYAARLAAEAKRDRPPPDPLTGYGSYGAEPFRSVGRNDPCPCGSGKNYKQCCLVIWNDILERVSH